MPAVPDLAVVFPLHDEEQVVPELLRRVEAAVQRTGRTYEIIPVNDASGDGTAALIDQAAAGSPAIRPVHLPRNLGQLAATREGVRHARAHTLVVIDGDLQDPPERIPDLLDALGPSPPPRRVAFAVKRERNEGALFRAGRGAYGLALRVLLPGVPSGAGSYCAFGRTLADAFAATRIQDANLAPLLIRLGAEPVVVPYAKAARYDGRSRVGAAGLLREAWGSLKLRGWRP